MGYARNLSYTAQRQCFRRRRAGRPADARKRPAAAGADRRSHLAAADGRDRRQPSAMNSQVQQLNLLTAAAIIQLRQQQTNGTLATSLARTADHRKQVSAGPAGRPDELHQRLSEGGRVAPGDVGRSLADHSELPAAAIGQQEVRRRRQGRKDTPCSVHMQHSIRSS